MPENKWMLKLKKKEGLLQKTKSSVGFLQGNKLQKKRNMTFLPKKESKKKRRKLNKNNFSRKEKMKKKQKRLKKNNLYSKKNGSFLQPNKLSNK